MKNLILSLIILPALLGCSTFRSHEWYQGPSAHKPATERAINQAIVLLSNRGENPSFDHGRDHIRLVLREPAGHLRDGRPWIYTRGGQQVLAYKIKGSNEIHIPHGYRFESLVHEVVHVLMRINRIPGSHDHSHPVWRDI